MKEYRISKSSVLIVILMAMAFAMLTFMPKAKAEDKLYDRYIIKVRIAKTDGQLTTFIKNNLTAIQTSLGKLRDVSQKINANNPGRSVEDTNKLTIDNNAVYLGVDASFAVPHPVPQAYLDEQATFENFLGKLSKNAMPDTENYQKNISKHVCNNGVMPLTPCTGVVNF